MKRVLYIILASLVLVGCGHDAPKVDGEFQSVVSEFNTDAAKFHAHDATDISIQFGATDGSTVCAQCSGDHKSITVRQDCWAHGDATTHKIMLYHELGHCALGLQHVDTADIMFPSRISEDLFNTAPDGFIEHLFKQ